MLIVTRKGARRPNGLLFTPMGMPRTLALTLKPVTLTLTLKILILVLTLSLSFIHFLTRNRRCKNCLNRIRTQHSNSIYNSKPSVSRHLNPAAVYIQELFHCIHV